MGLIYTPDTCKAMSVQAVTLEKLGKASQSLGSLLGASAAYALSVSDPECRHDRAGAPFGTFGVKIAAHFEVAGSTITRWLTTAATYGMDEETLLSTFEAVSAGQEPTTVFAPILTKHTAAVDAAAVKAAADREHEKLAARIERDSRDAAILDNGGTVADVVAAREADAQLAAILKADEASSKALAALEKSLKSYVAKFPGMIPELSRMIDRVVPAYVATVLPPESLIPAPVKRTKVGATK